jgi:hypothetical protein
LGVRLGRRGAVFAREGWRLLRVLRAWRVKAVEAGWRGVVGVRLGWRGAVVARVRLGRGGAVVARWRAEERVRAIG